MNSRLIRFLVVLIALTVFAPAHGQFGLPKKRAGNSDKSAEMSDADKRKAGANSSKPPELTDADKAKMAEIEQRPDVQQEIRQEWDGIRNDDLQFAYGINKDYGQLYDNPILQRYLNNIGQRLVPKDTPNIYSFRLLLDPVPRAEALSTGTIYVSTGLVAMLDNEAQLSYVLAHEIAHVEKNHHYNEIKNRIVQNELNADKERDAARKQEYIKLGASVAGAFTGGLAYKGIVGAIGGAAIGYVAGGALGQHLFRAKTTVTEWSELNEDEADASALPYMLDQNYDAREIPRLFARMSGLTSRDSRNGLGFIARADRVKLRNSHMQELLSGTVKARIDARLKAGGLTASTPEFSLLMSALKRDNGIVALDFDLFAMARDNLEDAVNLRSNDARAQLYLGKVISMTARTAEDRQAGLDHYLKAIQYDEGRGAYPDPHLERAIDMIAQSNSEQHEEIRKELQLYVALFQREHTGSLPPNMPIIYDYMQLAGDNNWYVAPTSVVSTKYVEALRVAPGGSTGPTNIIELTRDATAPAKPLPVAGKAATKPTKKNVSAVAPK